MEVFDKAKWQIDGGIDEAVVIAHFQIIFNWLHENHLLSKNGEQSYEFGIDEDTSLSENDVTLEAANFLKLYYDNYISMVAYGANEDIGIFSEMYEEFKSKNQKL